MKNSLANKVVVITGAGSGIGKATAITLAKAGATVIAVSRNTKHLDQCTAEIFAQGGKCFTFAVDLEELKEIKGLASRLAKKFKKIDWLINSAGYIEPEEKLKDFSPMFKVNTLAVIYLTRLLMSLLAPQGGIVNISSIAGIWGSAASPVYATSKSALNFYSQLTAQNFTNIKANQTCITICPGRTNTPMRQKIAGDAKLYQSPEVIGQTIEKIIAGQSKFKNGDLIIIKNGRTRLHARL